MKNLDWIDALVIGGVILVGLGLWWIHPAAAIVGLGLMAIIAGFVLANFR